MVLQSIKASPVETENASETWACLSVGIVPLQNFAKLLLVDKQTINPKKGVR